MAKKTPVQVWLDYAAEAERTAILKAGFRNLGRVMATVSTRPPCEPDLYQTSMDNTSDNLPRKPFARVRFPDGNTELIEGAVTVDTQNFHEGMIDFYDERGNLLRQIGMDAGATFELVE